MRVISVLGLIAAMFIVYGVFFETRNGGPFPDWLWWLSKFGKLVIAWIIIRHSLQRLRKPANDSSSTSQQSG